MEPPPHTHIPSCLASVRSPGGHSQGHWSTAVCVPAGRARPLVPRPWGGAGSSARAFLGSWLGGGGGLAWHAPASPGSVSQGPLRHSPDWAPDAGRLAQVAILSPSALCWAVEEGQKLAAKGSLAPLTRGFCSLASLCSSWHHPCASWGPSTTETANSESLTADGVTRAAPWTLVRWGNPGTTRTTMAHRALLPATRCWPDGDPAPAS